MTKKQNAITKTKKEEQKVRPLAKDEMHYFLDRFAKHMSEKGTMPVPTDKSSIAHVISPKKSSTGLVASDAKTMLPVFEGKFKPYYMLRTAVEDRDKVVYDIVFVPEVIDPVTYQPADLLKTFPIDFPTAGGVQRTRGIILWTLIRHCSKDPNTKRDVPVKVLFATPAMALRSMSPLNVLNIISQEEIVEGTRAIELHEALIIAEDRDNFRREADTAWEIVRRSNVSHFKSAGQMTEHADDAQTKGDESMRNAYVENKDLMAIIKENVCVIIFLAVLLLLMLTGRGGG